MFYILLALLFFAAFLYMGKDNMSKPLRYGFYSIIAIFLLVEVFSFIEIERALKGQEIVFKSYFDPGQAIIFNSTNGTQQGSASDVKYSDALFGNVTQNPGVPYIDSTVTLTGINEFDSVIVEGNYTGNISVSLLNKNGSYDMVGILYSNMPKGTTYNVTNPSNYNNAGTVKVRFLDNVAFGNYNLSLNYVGVNNFQQTKAYAPEGEDTQFIVAMHQSDYTGLILLTSWLEPVAGLFAFVLIIHYLKGWYEMYQGGNGTSLRKNKKED